MGQITDEGFSATFAVVVRGQSVSFAWKSCKTPHRLFTADNITNQPPLTTGAYDREMMFVLFVNRKPFTFHLGQLVLFASFLITMSTTVTCLSRTSLSGIRSISARHRPQSPSVLGTQCCGQRIRCSISARSFQSAMGDTRPSRADSRAASMHRDSLSCSTRRGCSGTLCGTTATLNHALGA